MNLLVVESPAKAKTINKYLGDGWKVMASYGHVRDLEAKDGSVKPDDKFSMNWQVDGRGEKQLAAIIKELKTADALYLATDPDREGEAIAWHLVDELKRRKKLAGKEIKRVTFNEITKNAVTQAMLSPRDIDQNLVEAYLARRALDYLVGFNLSPVLWRKLPGSRSAGRVQSVALRLICEREDEILAFKPQEYWTVQSVFTQGFAARLTHIGGEKLDKFHIANEQQAHDIKERLEKCRYTVELVEKKQVSRHPTAPFTTSTLQQEAARKLYFSAKKTMTVAQQLYEGLPVNGQTIGLITY
ncbi:MAG: DNA topoisomerase, partial [Alphaproteobacteria bacterium]|nr:DNA topoisomerase [Alphaproteobacteria bacterium]